MAERRPGECFAPGGYFVALRSRVRPERSAGLREAYEFRVDGRVFEVRVEDGECTTSEGSASQAPTAVFTMGVETLDQLLADQITATRAIADGSVQVTGDALALARFQEVFPPPDVPSAC